MQAVLMSIRPKWVQFIASGKKTVEVRKTRPKLETPFRVYIYCTKNYSLGEFYTQQDIFAAEAQGKVIGEFVCDDISEFKVFENGSVQYWNYHNLENTCLTYEELANYVGKDKNGYGWHISDLVIYDTPKELSEFFYACKQSKGTDCAVCLERRENNCKSIARPPQSWCYVEEREG